MTDKARIEKSFKRKARGAYKTAALVAKSDPNGAANRSYYCLYQAVVGELERLGVRPEQIDAGAAKAHKDDDRLKWTHSFVKRNASLAGLDGRQCSILRTAYKLRSTADYEDDDIGFDEVNAILKAIPDIFECLGITL